MGSPARLLCLPEAAGTRLFLAVCPSMQAPKADKPFLGPACGKAWWHIAAACRDASLAQQHPDTVGRQLLACLDYLLLKRGPLR